jgi:hypothetical protein
LLTRCCKANASGDIAGAPCTALSLGRARFRTFVTLLAIPAFCQHRHMQVKTTAYTASSASCFGCTHSTRFTAGSIACGFVDAPSGLYRQRRPHALPINQNRVRALCRGGMLRLLASRMATSVAHIDAPNPRPLVYCFRAIAARACNQQSVQQMISSQAETLMLRQRWIDSLAQGSECEPRSFRMFTSNDTWSRRFAQRSTWLLLVRADEPFTMASAPAVFFAPMYCRCFVQIVPTCPLQSIQQTFT